MAACSEDFLSGNDFEVFLAIFCSYDCSTNASETVEKIITDEKIITNGPCAA